MMSKPVDDIRREIDSLDDQVHDLLMKRAELVVRIGEEKRKNDIQVVQPCREMMMLRRLLARHEGLLPKEAIVRIWRELVGAVSLLQKGLKVVVTVPDDNSGLVYWDMAKDYFSSVLPMTKAANPLLAVSMVREGEATFAVVPWPADGQDKPWWPFLMDSSGDVPMRVVARLPLGDRSRESANPEFRALAVARLKFEPSGDDRSLLALALDHSVSRTRIVDQARELKLEPRSLYSRVVGEGAGNMHLLEVDGYVAADDERLKTFLSKLGAEESGKCLCLGGYPVPPVYDDKVGKNAISDSASSTEVKKSSSAAG